MMRRIAVVMGCVALLLAACGDDDGGTTAEEQIEEALEDVEEGDIPGGSGEEACNLVKQEDVEASFGGAVSQADDSGFGCDFDVAGSELGVDGLVSVRLDLTGGLDAGDVFEGSQEGYDPAAVEDVSGVGDGAYYVESAGALTVVEGDTLFTVQGVFLEIGTDATVDQADLQARVVDLAKVVAGRV